MNVLSPFACAYLMCSLSLMSEEGIKPRELELWMIRAIMQGLGIEPGSFVMVKSALKY